MDDYIGGAMSKVKAKQLRDNLIDIMASAGLKLRKWMSNDKDLVTDLESDTSITRMIGDSSTKILGLHWNSNEDVLVYTMRKVNDDSPITKRKILSEIATVFDPLGLLGPVIIKAKIIMQNLWHIRADWDEPLPENIREEWQGYRKGLQLVDTIAIPRRIIGNEKLRTFQVHGFADASLKAYGACIYLRSTDEYGNHTVNLICAKSKVAPLKVVSLPRLELCAALLLARLASRVIPKLNLNISKRKFWSDSSVVLSWIASVATRWKTFVAHRVGEIQELTVISEWAHVCTKDNPADVISRGCDMDTLGKIQIWWHGPEWLKEDIKSWPNTEKEANIIDLRKLPEAKVNTTEVHSFICTTIFDYPLLSARSSLKKIIRITAYCLRWRNNGLKTRSNIVGSLQVAEVEYANMALIKMVQRAHFNKEIKDLKSGKMQVSPTSKLFRLRPFYDKDEVLRVGGRLKNAIELDMCQRNPIVLPSDSVYTQLLFRNEHIELLHSGPQALIASIRQRYWPLKARNLARNTVHGCVTCFRLKPVVVQPIMGNFPHDRVNVSRPFSKCGVDFAGPIWIRTSLRRKAPCTKGYICLFVCFVTKAVHVEIVSDLTAKAFLRALNRFFDRRGKSATIYSDNATNFVGAQRHLREIYQSLQSTEHQNSISADLADKGVEWKFIPPRSPHFGGLWEAAVKSMKNLLYRVLGEARLTFEELSSVLTRIESCLNSRPITPMSSDPSDLSYLTPGHFLIGDTLTSVPERDETTTPDNRLDRWRRVTKYSQILWKRWHTEYLSQLQERTRWAGSKGPKIGLGSVVLIRDSSLPPLQWRLGRVVKVQVGSDGVIRSASVQTKDGELQRAVRLLCPLPFEGNIVST